MSANICINACGSNNSPQLIFNRKQLATLLVANGPPGSLYSTSSKGSMDQELFLLWFWKIFLAHTTHDQTQQLVMDNHSSHISLAIIKLARASNVIILALPSKTMHIFQPLDMAVFRRLAAHHATITTSEGLLKPNHRLNIADFVPIFRDAYTKAMTPESILASYKQTGVYPLGQELLNLYFSLLWYTGPHQTLLIAPIPTSVTCTK